MIGLTLKHLRYFQALAQHRHFGRAADACAISQPALSLQIKELEALFGVALVERNAREIRLTSVGEALLDKARGILLAVGELDDLARAAKGPLAGRLRMGVIPTVAPYLLPRIIAALSDRLPDLDLHLREAMTEVLIAELQEGRLDVAILALPISEPTLTEFALFDEDFVLVRPAEDAGNPVPSPQTLQTMRLLLLEEGHCFRDQVFEFCPALNNKQHSRLGSVLEGSSLETLKHMVATGLGITVLPETAVANVDKDLLETRPFTEPAPFRTVALAWRASFPRTQAIDLILNTTRQCRVQH